MNPLRLGRPFILILLLLAGTVSSCAGKSAVPVSSLQAPQFRDDSTSESLLQALRINLDYLSGQPPDKTVLLAGRKVPLARLHRSLTLFMDILAQNPSPAELDRQIKDRFEILKATGRQEKDGEMLITGYFQPLFDGSLNRQPPFIYPLYAVPDDLVLGGNGGKEPYYGRRDQGRLVPYWTRREIEEGKKAAGHELVWLQDPFDAFLVHIQGSALIRLQDGSRRGIHFAAKNGHPYRSIGSHLIRSGRLSRQETTMQTIRAYLAAHPEERDEIFFANPSFIFFAWTETPAVIGSLGRELTPGRSVAADWNCFPAGALAFLTSRRPTVADGNQVSWSPLHRFVVIQDSGSAIKGSGRIDLFWGTGAQAGAEAGLMKEAGSLYLLLAKEKQPVAARKTAGGGA